MSPAKRHFGITTRDFTQAVSFERRADGHAVREAALRMGERSEGVVRAGIVVRSSADQLGRAALSIVNDIAEGAGKSSKPDKSRSTR